MIFRAKTTKREEVNTAYSLTSGELFAAEKSSLHQKGYYAVGLVYMANRSQKLNIRKPVVQVLASVSDKNREVLERRFGIGRDCAETLESIGQSYGITRERVRQIQEYGLKRVLASDAKETLAPIFSNVGEFIQSKGGVVREQDLFEALATPKERAYLSFALRLMPNITYIRETNEIDSCYTMNGALYKQADAFICGLHRVLSKERAPIPFSQLLAVAKAESENLDSCLQNSLEYTLCLSRRIKQGPFGDYGLVDWSTIRPKGVRDKAHLVFEKEKKPLHFKDISALIDKYFVPKSASSKTNSQTVHNELIKDPRFVLIGRGLYALAEWGYNPGTVKDVLVQILKDGGQPLEKEKILDLISERRFVKPNTVFLNLQNKNYFKRMIDGKYYLA